MPPGERRQPVPARRAAGRARAGPGRRAGPLRRPGGGPAQLLLRLARLGPAAIALAQAVAILERDARLVTAAALAELDEPAARAAADALIAARVLDAAHPLRFAHPVLRAAVYADVGLARRAAGHRRAAELLDASAPDRAALHLLATHPSGDPWVLDRLRAAADRALAQGSTGGARALLERALEEAPARRRDTARARRGRAAQRPRRPPPRGWSRRSRWRRTRGCGRGSPASSPRCAGRTATSTRRSACSTRSWPTARPRLELEADRAAFAVLGAPERRPAEGLDRAETLAGDTPAERRMLATLAFHRMIWGVTTGAEVGRLAERALAGGRLLEDVGPGHPSVLAVLSTLQVVERDADVEALIATARAAAPVEAAVLRAHARAAGPVPR